MRFPGRAAPAHPPRVRGWGTPGSPDPCGRAQPAHTLPPGGRLGNPGFPGPLRAGAARSNLPPGWEYGEPRVPHAPVGGRSPLQPSPRVGVWGTPGSPCPCGRAQPAPHPSPGWEYGEPRVPHAPARGRSPPTPSRAGERRAEGLLMPRTVNPMPGRARESMDMVFEKFIRYAGLAVGLKSSATECEARLRGL